MKRIITQEQEIFIRKFYPEKGSIFCATALNLKSRYIINFCSKNKIKISANRLKIKSKENILKAQEKRKNKTNKDYKVNPEHFLEIKTAEIAYILGLLWADGYIYHKNSTYKIEINSLKEDLEQVKNIFFSTGKWCCYDKQRVDRQPSLLFCTNNKILYSFLAENDYEDKSLASADKILSKIPENLQHYWFRGLIDGDGCFYINEKNKIFQFSICGSFNQNWSFVERLLKKLDIKYSISKRIVNNKGKENKSSIVRVCNKNNIKIIIDYIYNNREIDKIGFSRKFEKAKLILSLKDKEKTGPKQCVDQR